MVVVDKLLAAHFGLEEEGFEYKWNCIFPESAGQKAIREKDYSETQCRLVETGILSEESALDQLKAYGSVEKDAKVGLNPNKIKKETGANNAT